MTSNAHLTDDVRPNRRGFRLAMIVVSGALLSGAAILPASAATVSAMPAGPVASVVQGHDWHHDHDDDHHDNHHRHHHHHHHHHNHHHGHHHHNH
ncbi:MULTISPECIES: hypothetical protein [unclassified Streptomyces]|uniref:hypothetical protein n=1 Tax=unclassified Streptomyces TaxID=2593676 RepID=UPI002E34BC87|nr:MULTISPECIES: hypothetical protein [unclassified Streptomyces]WUC68072.1 hypothetical protein OG861_29660 [Streptomyces sp. NBC_00539]